MDLSPRELYQIDIPADQARWPIFLAPYDLALTLPPGILIEIGRFSAALIGRLHIAYNSDSRLVLRAGAFCEAAKDSAIIVGGEHRNDSLFNCSLTGGKAFRIFMDEEADQLTQVRPSGPILLADNALISTGAIVLAGASIGAGTIIAAGAVVSGVCDDYSIYGGVPARLLRSRFSAELVELHRRSRFADVMAHHIPRLPILLDRLQSGQITLEQYLEQVTFLPKRPTVHLSAKPMLPDGGVMLERITGYSLDGEPVSHPKLDGYFEQMLAKQGPVMWTADIFHSLGLY